MSKHHKMKQSVRYFLTMILCLCMLAGCGSRDTAQTLQTGNAAAEYHTEIVETDKNESTAEQTQADDTEKQTSTDSPSDFEPADVPDYSGDPYIAVNNNEPYFTADDLTTEAFENYSELDALGRCGTAYANVCLETMPTEKRGSISEVKPTGWHSVKYDNVDGKSLYNRCHLIGYQLTAENANKQNLITGTRYLNVDGMLPFENMVADYVKETNNHVLYRVTPIFTGDNLVADGVLMEGYSVEDEGDGICFCVYAYNVQPGITIDYATGDSWLSGEGSSNGSNTGSSQVTKHEDEHQEDAHHDAAVQTEAYESETTAPASTGTEYILNTNTKKFHYPSCSSVKQMKNSNKQEFTGSRDDLIAQGYDPCKKCNP